MPAKISAAMDSLLINQSDRELSSTQIFTAAEPFGVIVLAIAPISAASVIASVIARFTFVSSH
jgi:hypothetical protein